MRRLSIPALALSALLLGSACQGPPVTDANRTDIAAGAGLGAVTGGLLGSLSGNFGWGALIGGAAGAAGGYLYDRGGGRLRARRRDVEARTGQAGLLTPLRRLDRRSLPPLLIYLAAGVSGFAAIADSFWVRRGSASRPPPCSRSLPG